MSGRRYRLFILFFYHAVNGDHLFRLACRCSLLFVVLP